MSNNARPQSVPEHRSASRSEGHLCGANIKSKPTIVRLPVKLQPTIPGSNFTNCRSILVVDDEPVIGKMITRFLGKHMPDYSVIYFTSGESALVYLKNNTTVGLLLTDIEMPGITGLELASQVKALYPALPIIVMSGTADGQHREEIFKLGADFISKPFNLADLLGKLMNLLGDKRSFCGGRDTENKV